MEILQTLVEIPEIELSTFNFKNPLMGSQEPLISIRRFKLTQHYKLAISFITRITDSSDFSFEIEIKIGIRFKFTGPPLVSSDLYSLYTFASAAGKKEITDHKLFSPKNLVIIIWQPFSLRILEAKLDRALKTMSLNK